MAKRRIGLILGAIVLVSLVAAGVIAVLGGSSGYRGSSIDTRLPASDFSLTDQDGAPFRLFDQRGKVVLLFFGYTSCPDVCPTTLGEFKQLHDLLGPQAQDVEMVFVTVDPQRDTPQRMKAYLDNFGAGIIGLSADEPTLKAIWDAYGVFVEKGEGLENGGYTVTHSSLVYGINRAGDLRVTFPFGMTVADMAHDVRVLVREKTS